MVHLSIFTKDEVSIFFLLTYSALKCVPEKQTQHGYSAEQNQQKGAFLSLGNNDSFNCLFIQKRPTVGSHFIIEINDLFTEIVTLQLYKADIILLRIKYKNSDRFSTV